MTALFHRLLRLVAGRGKLPGKWASKPWKEVPFLAIDLELTSLDAKQAQILSIGWVEGVNSQIELHSCHYQVITTKASLNQSPTIHGLLQTDIQQGDKVASALKLLLEKAQTHVWVFHCADLDLAVITGTLTKLNIALPEVVIVDTLRLALYQLAKRHSIPAPNAATLASCRQRFDLPLAPAHNALDDAMATMELLFAQLNDFDPQGKEPLSALRITKALSKA